MKYYSPSKKGFFTDEIHKDIPADKIEITDEEHMVLLNNGGEIALGPSGKPEIKPSHFHTLNSSGNDWEITSENQTIKYAGEAEVSRKEDIKQSRESSGLKKISIEQAYDFIDNKLDAASTAAETKEALRDILKKMIPHILD